MSKKEGTNKGLAVLLVILIAIVIITWSVVLMLYLNSRNPGKIQTREATEEIAEGEILENMPEAEKDADDLDEETINDLEDMKEIEEEKREKVDIEKLKINLESNYDDMQDITWIHSKGERIYNGNNGSEKFYFYLYLGEQSGHLWGRFATGFAKEGWVFFEQISVKTDDYRFDIPFDSLRDRKGEVHYGGIQEWIDIPVDSEMVNNFKKVIDSKESKIRFTGDTSYVDYNIDKEQIEQLKNIINYYEAMK